MGACVESDVTVNLDVALETTGNPHVARANDLALDGQVRGNDRFFHVEPLRFLYRAASRIGAERGDISLFRLTGVRRGSRVREVLRWRRARLGGRIFPERHE